MMVAFKSILLPGTTDGEALLPREVPWVHYLFRKSIRLPAESHLKARKRKEHRFDRRIMYYLPRFLSKIEPSSPWDVCKFYNCQWSSVMQLCLVSPSSSRRAGNEHLLARQVYQFGCHPAARCCSINCEHRVYVMHLRGDTVVQLTLGRGEELTLNARLDHQVQSSWKFV